MRRVWSLASAAPYAGYAMTPDGDEDYDFTLLTGSADNSRSALIIPAQAGASGLCWA